MRRRWTRDQTRGYSQSASQFASCECGACGLAPVATARRENRTHLKPQQVVHSVFLCFLVQRARDKCWSERRHSQKAWKEAVPAACPKPATGPEPRFVRHSLALRFTVGVHGKVGGDRLAERFRVDASCASKSGCNGGDEISGALRCEARARLNEKVQDAAGGEACTHR